VPRTTSDGIAQRVQKLQDAAGYLDGPI